ncbi:MAG: hypothetical protein IJU50_03150 [Lachnospiraceae bacterium]|nr:hypothetical protein [Lachnospiraceae bacterium]
MGLLNTIISVIVGRFQMIIARIRLLLNPTYLRTVVYTRIRQFFMGLFDVRPRNKDDYYEIFGWMVSKKLAFSVVVIAGVLSVAYLYNIRSIFLHQAPSDGIKTYKYNSILLKFAKGKVRIKGKSGYIAYEGEVTGGQCAGQGTLYSPSDKVVYQGAFDNSMYEGVGKYYYPEGPLHYSGSFHENLYSGEGKLYRVGGSMEYSGAFEQGMKEGLGTLYNTGQDMLYEGEFSRDDILFSDLLGNTPQEVSDSYGGNTVLYHSDNERVRMMNEIEAMTLEQNDSESVDDEEYTVKSVYVLRDYIRFGGTEYRTFSELDELLGDPLYEGVSRATLGEAVAANYMNRNDNLLYGMVDIDTDPMFTEYEEVLSYDMEYELYLHTYHRGGLIYTFVGRHDRDDFVFYYITGEDVADLAS